MPHLMQRRRQAAVTAAQKVAKQLQSSRMIFLAAALQ
jgi:hypothetical protein